MDVFGPILSDDAIRVARRGRQFFVRVVYGLVLLGTLYLTYYQAGQLTSTWIDIREQARLAEQFFGCFTLLQFAFVLLVTPAYVAGAVAEETHRRTLESLLTAPLSDEEIIVGKVGSRLIHVTALLASSLPILYLLLLMGGVSPARVFASFAGTIGLMLMIAGISIYHSVDARNPTAALTPAYVSSGVLTLFATPSIILLVWPDVERFGPFWLVFAFSLLLDIAVAVKVTHSAAKKLRPAFLRNVHLIATSHRLHVTPRASLAEPNSHQKEPIGQHLAMDDAPMLWKEGVTGFRSTRDMVLVACFLAFGPGGLYLTMAWTDGMPVELATAVIRFLWILVVLPICVMTAMRAGGAVRSEMDQRTMEGLLATPLTIREILRAKWLAALVYPRVEYLFLGVFLGVGVLGGGLHPLMLPVVVLVFTIFASFTTSLGLVIGLLARSTSRTHFWTLISVVCLLAGAPSWTYWFLGPQRSDCSMSTPTAFALTPAAVLWDIIWNGPFPKLGSSRESTFALINVALHAAAAYALWRYALHAFLRTSGRTDHGGEVMKILEKGA